MISTIKLIGAFLLLACFALPMTSCTTHENEAGKFVTVKPGEPLPPGVHVVHRHYYLLDELRVGGAWPWLANAGFVCPAAAVVYSRRHRDTQLSRVVWHLEPILIAWALFGIWYVSFLTVNELEVGTYVAIAGVVLYSLGWAAEAYSKLHNWWRRHRAAA